MMEFAGLIMSLSFVIIGIVFGVVAGMLLESRCDGTSCAFLLVGTAIAFTPTLVTFFS